MKFHFLAFVLSAAVDGAEDGVCLLQNGFLGSTGVLTNAEMKDTAFPRLLLVQTSRLISLESRLLSSRDTWIQRFKQNKGNDRLITVVSKGKDEVIDDSAFPPELGITVLDCPDSHDLTCTLAEVQRLTLPMMEDFDALFIFDDDVYLFPENLKSALRHNRVHAAGREEHAPETGRIEHALSWKGGVFGVFGCGLPCCQEQGKQMTVHGWCGGSGYGMSRDAAMRLMKTPLGASLPLAVRDYTEGIVKYNKTATRADGYVNEFLRKGLDMMKRHEIMTGEHEPRGDVHLGAAWKEAGLPVWNLDGLYGWSVKGEELDKKLQSCDPPPVLFHYVNDETKRYIDSKVEIGWALASTCDKDPELSNLQFPRGDEVKEPVENADWSATENYTNELDAYVARNGIV
jgi:hypothetical protein